MTGYVEASGESIPERFKPEEIVENANSKLNTGVYNL